MNYEGFVDSEGFDGGDGQVGVVGDGERALRYCLLTAVYSGFDHRAAIKGRLLGTVVCGAAFNAQACLCLLLRVPPLNLPPSAKFFGTNARRRVLVILSQVATPWNSLTRRLSPALRTTGLRSRRLLSSRSPSLAKGTPGAAAAL